MPAGKAYPENPRTLVLGSVKTNEEMLKNYTDRLSTASSSRSVFIKYAQDYLNYSHGKFDRQTIDRFITHLRKKGYKDSSVNLIVRIARTLCVRNKIEWPLRRGELPVVRETTVLQPVQATEIILREIRAVKEMGTPQEKALLAVSTTWATRAQEKIDIEPGDLNLQDRVIFIKTAKRGRERYHLIPEELVPIFTDYSFADPISKPQLLFVWYRIERLAGIPHRPRVGWHSIRRQVMNLMQDAKFSDGEINTFTRHKMATGSNILDKYTTRQYVNYDEEKPTIQMAPTLEELDRRVYSVLPFVSAWGEHAQQNDRS